MSSAPEDRPWLYYIPGLDGTGKLFYNQAAPLAAHFNIHCSHLRETGKFTYKDLLADLVTEIQTNPYPVVVCAESFGGTLALQLALKHPELIAKLIIINSFPYFRNRVLLYTGQILLEFIPHELVTLGHNLATHLGIIGESLPSPDREKFASITEAVPKLATLQRLALIAKYDLRKQLRHINQPTLFIASREDRLQNSVQEAEYMASQMPQAQVKVIEGMGHVMLPSPNFSLLKVLEESNFLAN